MGHKCGGPNFQKEEYAMICTCCSIVKFHENGIKVLGKLETILHKIVAVTEIRFGIVPYIKQLMLRLSREGCLIDLWKSLSCRTQKALVYAVWQNECQWS